MEEQVRKELLHLCNDIIENQDDAHIEEHLTSVQMLYEKLLVLNYLASHKTSARPNETTPKETKSVPSQTLPDMRESSPQKPILEESPETSSEPVARESKNNPEPPQQEAPPPAQRQHTPPEAYSTPEFVRADTSEKSKSSYNESPVPEDELTDDKTPEEQSLELSESDSDVLRPQKSSSINERYGSGAITLGLNDRIAFMNNLFDGSQEDLNRVLSQINTFESLAEAENFIEQMVKPDYDWSQKEEFEIRFMNRIRQRFGE